MYTFIGLAAIGAMHFADAGFDGLRPYVYLRLACDVFVSCRCVWSRQSVKTLLLPSKL